MNLQKGFLSRLPGSPYPEKGEPFVHAAAMAGSIVRGLDLYTSPSCSTVFLIFS